MDELAGVLSILDFAAVAVFGATGALAAARRKHDIVTFAFFAAVTGVGGGTLRDLLIGAPVFWVGRPAYLLACLAAALAVWVFGWGHGRERILTWLDAVGMAAYAVVGALKALSLGAPPLSAVVMGVLTSTFGGVLRDVLAEEPSVLLRRELYVTAALAGAGAFVLLELVGLAPWPAGLGGFAVALAVRAGAILFRWSLPGFPGRAPPTGWDIFNRSSPRKRGSRGFLLSAEPSRSVRRTEKAWVPAFAGMTGEGEFSSGPHASGGRRDAGPRTERRRRASPRPRRRSR